MEPDFFLLAAATIVSAVAVSNATSLPLPSPAISPPPCPASELTIPNSKESSISDLFAPAATAPPPNANAELTPAAGYCLGAAISVAAGRIPTAGGATTQSSLDSSTTGSPSPEMEPSPVPPVKWPDVIEWLEVAALLAPIIAMVACLFSPPLVIRTLQCIDSSIDRFRRCREGGSRWSWWSRASSLFQ